MILLKKASAIQILLSMMFVASAQAQYSWDNLPVVQQPVFKKDTFNIKDFGAIADGVRLNTESINKAIATCSLQGGGVVVIPQGLWLSGPVEMKSNVNLHLQASSMLLFTTDKTQFPLVEGIYEGKAAARNQSPIWGNNLENIAITGSGIVDGNGDVWRAVWKSQLTKAEWQEKIASGGVLNKDSTEWFPSQQFLDVRGKGTSMLLVPGKKLEQFADMKDFLRPNLVVFNNCNKVLLEGVVFQNSAAWCLHPLMCENLTIRNVRVKNPEYAHNGDGMDIESCKNFLIEDCLLDVGDDAICIKSGKDEEGRKRGKPTENGIIRNNTIYKGHGAFVIGSEMSGGARNIFVENCTFIGTDKGLRFKSTRGRGGVVENIYARNIIMKDIKQEAIFFDMYYFVKFATDGARDTRPVVNEGTPIFRNMEFANITSIGSQKGIFIRGLSEMPIQNININNSSFSAAVGVELADASGISLSNIQLKTTKPQPLISMNNVQGITANTISYPTTVQKVIKVQGDKNEKITISKSGKITADKVEIGKEVDKKVVQIN
jgi:polygalacturonase